MASRPTTPSGDRRDTSVLYSYMPSAVQSRFSAFPSFRQSLRSASNRQPGATQSEPDLPGAAEPREEDGDRPNTSLDGLSEAAMRGRQFMPFGIAGGLRRLDTPSVLLPLRDESPGSSRPRTPSSTQTTLRYPVEEEESGVEWDTAETALILLKRACETAERDGARPQNTRALIVDANKYLLRSLPNNLGRQEIGEIEEAFLARIDPADRPLYQLGRNRPMDVEELERHSWLRKAIAFLILQSSLLIAFIIPYIVFLANTLYHLERSHRVTERLFIHGLDVTNLVGEQGLDLRDAAARFGQGRFGVSLVQTGTWLLESVVGGVSDGAGQGVAVVGQAMLPQLTGKAAGLR